MHVCLYSFSAIISNYFYQLEAIWTKKLGSTGIALTKGLPYRIFMKQIIYEIIERGQLHQLLKKWKIPQSQCNSKQSTGKPLSLEKLISAFMIVLFGMICALLLLFIEKLLQIYNVKSKQMKHTNSISNITRTKKARLQGFVDKFQKILNSDEFFLEDESTMRALLKEMKKHNLRVYRSQEGKLKI